MKARISKRILRTLLVCILAVGLVLAAAVTASAAEKTEITEIKCKISSEHVPRAGMEVDDFMPNCPDDAPYSRDWDGSAWVTEEGTALTVRQGQHFDIGYEFEAGRTYTTDFYFDTKTADYVFAENPTVVLEGPDPSMFTYEITGLSDGKHLIYVRFTFTIPGERDYPDMNKVALMSYNLVAEGRMPETATLLYNNCTITRQEWNKGTWGSTCKWDTSQGDTRFKAGETYVQMIELTAKKGYKFSENVLVQKGKQSAEEVGKVTLSADRTVATVTFTYPIAAYELIDTIKLSPASQFADFCVRSDFSGYLMEPFTTAYNGTSCPYEEIQNFYDWYDNETGKKLPIGYKYSSFEAGKSYTLNFKVEIKDDYMTTHRFAENLKVVMNGYQYAKSDFVDVQVSQGGGSQAAVTVTYTCQFPKGAGSTANNPVICRTYDTFKFAMENKDIRYVALGTVNETMPVGETGLVTAIQVNGIKNLHLLGDAVFTAPAMTETTYAALLHTQQNDTLNISGAGSLEFKAVASNSFNAVIYNQGGWVSIDSGTLIGSYNTAVYGKAIWQEYGELRISDGQFLTENALSPLSLPRAKTAVTIQGGQAWIQGGTFRMRNMINTIDLSYGLEIGQNATVDLSGGTFHGILLPTSSTPLANYMDEDFYTALTDESKFDPESVHSQEYTASENIVRIVWIIEHVDVHINAPAAGVTITENYFNIPTSGCEAAMYYPQWYKNGEPVTYGTFEAGESYKAVVQIEVKPGYNAEFTNDITASVNNKSVTVDRLSAHWIEIEYDFGACPDVISFVELTVTAPKEGNNPSYSVGCGSDAYRACGSYNNLTDYRTWYVSNTGADGSWTVMNTSDKFMAGKHYKFVTDVMTKSRYVFSLYDNGSSIVPDVSAAVNGYYARVMKTYDADPSLYITVEYNFGECNDSIVEKIAVADIVKPVAGERPSYICNILGTGYKLNTDKNVYKDDWMHDQKLYYIKNGIGWFDLTESDWVYEHETFIAGHEYKVNVYLLTEDGYEFAHNKWYEPTVSATVNGNIAAAVIGGSVCISSQEVEYTFTCEKKDVSAVMMMDLAQPQAGKVPDYDITLAYPQLYQLDTSYGMNGSGIYWYDCEGNTMMEGDTFRQGERYKVEMKIVPVKAGGVNVCQFVTPFKAYVNGEEVTERLNWDAVYVSNDAVYVYYTFMKGASAPEAPSMTEVSGTVTSFGSSSDAITIQLFKDGSASASYEETLQGSSTSYAVSGVTTGSYTVEVSKANHVTREYEVTVGTEPVDLDVTINLAGDIDGNGDITSKDKKLLYNHINDPAKQLTGYEYDVADVSGEGELTSKDKKMLYNHLNDPSKSLWS